jgi:FkbM family methyltransferase
MRRRVVILAALAVIASTVAAVALLRENRSDEPFPRVVADLGTVLTYLDKQPSLSIVQIGAYIGKTSNDPLYEFLCERMDPAKVESSRRKTKVVLVEPIRKYFDLLLKNYSKTSGIEFENVAIAETEGVMEMYRLDVDPVKYGYPAWLAQLSSLKKERTEELWDKNERNQEYKEFYLKHRVVEKVRCMTLKQLLDKHQIRQLDLLVIDTEGYDYMILKTLDFKKLKPRFINYERALLQEDEPACRRMLEAQGYRLIDWSQDTLAIRQD